MSSLLRYAMLPCRSKAATAARIVLVVQITPDAAADLKRLADMRHSVQGDKGKWLVDAAPLKLQCWTVATAAGMAEDHGSMTDFVHGVVAPTIGMPRQTAMFRTLMTGPGVVVDEAGPFRAYLASWGAEQIDGAGRVTIALTSRGVRFVLGDAETVRWTLDALVGPQTETP